MRSEGQFSRLVKALAFELIDASGVQRFLFAAKAFLGANGYAFEYSEPTWVDPDTTTGLFSSGVLIAGQDTARSRLYATTDDNAYAVASVVSSQGVPFSPSTAELFAQTVAPASLARLRCMIDTFTNASRVEIASDTAAYNGGDLATWDAGSYVPTPVNYNAGATGTNTITWTYIGGPNVGDAGELSISWTLLLNGGGAAVTGTPVIQIPAQFNMVFADAVNSHRLNGQTVMSAGGVGTVGLALRQSVTNIGFQVLGSAGAYINIAGIGAGVPGVWAAGDFIRANLSVQVVRV